MIDYCRTETRDCTSCESLFIECWWNHWKSEPPPNCRHYCVTVNSLLRQKFPEMFGLGDGVEARHRATHGIVLPRKVFHYHPRTKGII